MGTVASARVDEVTENCSRVEIRSHTEFSARSFVWWKNKEKNKNHAVPLSLQQLDPDIWNKFMNSFDQKEPINRYRSTLSTAWYAYIIITAFAISLFGTIHKQHFASIFVAVGFGILIAFIIQSCWYHYALRSFYYNIIKEHSTDFSLHGLSLEIEEYWHWYSGDKGYYAMVIVVQPLVAHIPSDADLAHVLDISYTSYTRQRQLQQNNTQVDTDASDHLSIIEAGQAIPSSIDIPVAVPANRSRQNRSWQQRRHPPIARVATTSEATP
uniref:Uncharacterized protein n=1 Tax=Aureoumbra lagunensis TaxID=44058 RepID=A0A7S3JQM8_9STRA|mmetsp:Transcript_18064/g.27246  ORF Transcript_18064/g.27246 Transcript_18064/m.27246 type:complete len:269 (-) Transcript_18064:207-1013(-)